MTHCNDILKSIQAAKENKPCTFDLNHFGNVYIYGKDAQKFLQGQLTCDVNTLPSFKAQPTACCNLQGRIIALLFLMIWKEGYLILLPKNILESTLKHFKKYAVFSKVIFEPNFIQHITGFSNSSDSAPIDSYTCLTNLFIKPELPSPVDALKHEAWHYQQMIQGFPDIYPDTQEVFLPHRIGLDKINDAIGLKKGCYLGQEIIARMHFKAIQKHAIYLCETQMNFLPGASLFDSSGEENIGEVLDISEHYFLAAIKVEALEKIPDTIKVIS